MTSDIGSDLQAYFTDMEPLRELFRSMLVASPLPRRLFAIHGVGGIGKTSLLRMFRLYCKQEKVLVGLASGDEPETKAVVGLLAGWGDDLRADKMALPVFAKTLAHYRLTLGKVSEQARKAQEAAREKAAESMGKTAAKVIIKGALGAIPLIGGLAGELAGELGGAGAEALMDWLRSRGFTEADIDLLLDPDQKLTKDFLSDVAKIAARQRLVLIFDTFEQIPALGDWARDFAQQLHPNILLVIAGRALPDWHRQWPSWLGQAEVHELKPMTEAVMRDLVRRYYATMRGGEPSAAQVEAIIRFACGLPMVVTSAVQLWVKYGVEDFRSIQPEIVADLVDRLKEGVPDALMPTLEAAATVRWFDQPILRAVTGMADVRDVYNELRRFPFVRARVEGLALHDAVRAIMDENLRAQDSERYRDLHERAAAYFESRQAKAAGEAADRLGLERLYHQFRVNEEIGVQMFQEIAEGMVRYRLVNRLRTLLSDVDTYRLERDNSRLWREYYQARLAQLETRAAEAEAIYQSISDNEQADPKLRAYALCDWGQLLSHYERLGQAGGVEKATTTLEKSLALGGLDSHLVRSLFHLARVQGHQRRRKETAQLIDRARDFCEQAHDAYGLSSAYVEMKRRSASMGLWQDFCGVQDRLVELSRTLPESAALKNRTLGDSNWAWALAGRLIEGERNAREGLVAIRSLGDRISLANVLRDLGLILGCQDRWDEASRAFSESLELAEAIGATFLVGSIQGFWGAILKRQGRFVEAAERLTQSIQLKEQMKDPGIVEAWTWLGELREIQKDWGDADCLYRLAADYHQFGLYYFSSGSLTGLARIRHAQGDYAAIPPLCLKTEETAEPYEYNDHLASLRLTRGHLVWDGHIPEWDRGFDAALHDYQRALIHALRYNRFLLDELLSGRPQGTPLRPLVPHCLERGAEGRQMLGTLRDWWRTSANDLRVPRPDTLSPIPEGIPLLKAERIARDREPGDGTPQKTVVEQIEAAISS